MTSFFYPNPTGKKKILYFWKLLIWQEEDIPETTFLQKKLTQTLSHFFTLTLREKKKFCIFGKLKFVKRKRFQKPLFFIKFYQNPPQFINLTLWEKKKFCISGNFKFVNRKRFQKPLFSKKSVFLVTFYDVVSLG